jgi:hypothetical protein
MWQLMMTNAAKEWVEAGNFETVTAAARRIREIEGRATGGIFLRMLVEIDFGSDDEAFGHLGTQRRWLRIRPKITYKRRMRRSGRVASGKVSFCGRRAPFFISLKS